MLRHIPPPYQRTLNTCVPVTRAIAAIALLACLFTAALLAVRIYCYRSAILYDISADYSSLSPVLGSHSIPLASSSNVLRLPRVAGSWGSAFVEITVKARLTGYVFDPAIQMRLGEGTATQYLERGASGRRFLNVTSLLEGASLGALLLTLEGTHVSVLTDSARLHVMRAPAATEGTALVMSPHPDDAEIAAFGFYSTRPSWIVTVTTGETGRSLYSDFFDTEREAREEKARMRAWDSIAIPRLGGVPSERAINLGYFDGTLAAMYDSPESPVEGVAGSRNIAVYRINPFDTTREDRPATWRQLVDDFILILTQVRPTAIVLPHPLMDTHLDHQYSTIALLQALAVSNLRDGRLLFYTNHPVGTELHPFGPRDGVVSVAPMLTSLASIESIVSVPLTRRTQLRKQVALELEQGLRSAPALRPPHIGRVLLDGVLNLLGELTAADASYARRAVRPNEIFYVMDFVRGETVIDEFVNQGSSPE